MEQNPPASAVAATLRQVVKDTGLTELEVADRVGIPVPTLKHRLEDEPGRLMWDDIRAIALLAGRSAASIISDSARRAPAGA